MIDPIVADVRNNREELFAEFDNDYAKLREHLDSQRLIWEASGVCYVSEDERQARLALCRAKRESENRRIAEL